MLFVKMSETLKAPAVTHML